MHYTILYATSCRNCDLIVDLCKNGNMYHVVVWNRAKHITERKYECERYDDAEQMFRTWCGVYDMTQVNNVEQAWDASDFD